MTNCWRAANRIAQCGGNDPQRVRLAQAVCAAAKQEMGWPSDYFIPDDPFDIVFWPHEDALDQMCAVLDIEERLEIVIDDAVAESWAGKTINDIVDYFLTKSAELSPALHSEGRGDETSPSA